MSSPAGGALRLTRAAVLGSATVGLALAAHVLAGGAAPTPVGIGLLALPMLAVALLVTGVRLSGPAVAGLVGASQVALHLGLTALAAPTGVVAGAGTESAGHHLLHLTLGPAVGVGGASTGAAGAIAGAPSGAGGALVWAGVAMTLAHVVAAGLVALLLTHGEQALWALLGWLLPRRPGPVRDLVPSARPHGRPPVAVRSSGHVRRPPSRAPPGRPSALPAPSA